MTSKLLRQDYDQQITVSKLWWYNYNKGTMVVRLQQADYSSTIMIDRLLWYNYGKPCFCSFKGEGKEHKGGQKRKVREEKRKQKK